ncbi:50S ribosomal protein L17 [Candidatus Daviesbacteria bacterium]|nr:50S ribosomal protein L17 [Candidatus Daviesbacteria bacterium]
MRHKVYGKHLGRNKDERKALFKNLVQSLFLSESIKTTEPKAKAIKGLVDKIVNQAKSPQTRRLVSQFLTKKEVTDKLIKDLLPRLKSRTSGYTSVVKLGRRQGDGAMVVQMSLLVESAAPVKSVRSIKTQETTAKAGTRKAAATEKPKPKTANKETK